MAQEQDALNVEAMLSDAVKHFWRTRTRQQEKQGSQTGRKDAGSRGAVTGGKHADGFVTMIAQVVTHAGLPGFSVHTTTKRVRTLPGYYRPCKEWDVLVVEGGERVAAIEVKSQVGSFGNNFNKRVEEALGNARDFWMAVSKERFGAHGRPWLGYFFMLEENPDSTTPTKRIKLAPFAVDEPFQQLSYARRYEEVCRRMVLEGDYNAACFFTSNRETGQNGEFHRASTDDLSIRTFARSLHAHVAARRAIK